MSPFSKIIGLLWLFCLFLTILGLFLSIWIILPAPTFTLLPLGVGAPEISPWLIVINLTAFVLVFLFHARWSFPLILIITLISILISLLPLSQLPIANRQFTIEFEAVLSHNYLENIPAHFLSNFRQQVFSLKDFITGISSKPIYIKRGVTFAHFDDIDLKLNLYRPSKEKQYPTLVIIYGGAWRSGSPNDYEQFSRYIAAQGYLVITIDYRHAPKYQFPTQLEDVEFALNYIEKYADSLGVDRDKVALMGRSAGAHLASLLAYQKPDLPIRAVINYYGPVDLTQGYYDPPFPDPIDSKTVLSNFLGGSPKQLPKLYRQASPIDYIKPKLPPSLLIYAGRDRLVQAKFGRLLNSKLKRTDNLSIYLEIPWAEHAFDTIFFGVSNQLALYYTERFLAWALHTDSEIH